MACLPPALERAREGPYQRIARGIYLPTKAEAAQWDWIEAATRRPDATIYRTSYAAHASALQPSRSRAYPTVLGATAADLGRELSWQGALANTLLRLANASRRTGDDHVAEAAPEAAAILRQNGRDLLEPSHGAAARSRRRFRVPAWAAG